MERSRAAPIVPASGRPGCAPREALGERGKRLVKLHPPSVGPSCLRGKRLCQSSRSRNIGETGPRSTFPTGGRDRPDQAESDQQPSPTPKWNDSPRVHRPANRPRGRRSLAGHPAGRADGTWRPGARTEVGNPRPSDPAVGHGEADTERWAKERVPCPIPVHEPAVRPPKREHHRRP